MDLQLKGKKAVVSGGTRGIGRAIVDVLTDEGCDVAICARNADMVEEAVASFSAKGVNAFGQSVDFGDGDALKAWVQASAEALGGIDILVPTSRVKLLQERQVGSRTLSMICSVRSGWLNPLCHLWKRLMPVASL